MNFTSPEFKADLSSEQFEMKKKKKKTHLFINFFKHLNRNVSIKVMNSPHNVANCTVWEIEIL